MSVRIRELPPMTMDQVADKKEFNIDLSSPQEDGTYRAYLCDVSGPVATGDEVIAVDRPMICHARVVSVDTDDLMVYLKINRSTLFRTPEYREIL